MSSSTASSTQCASTVSSSSSYPGFVPSSSSDPCSVPSSLQRTNLVSRNLQHPNTASSNSTSLSSRCTSSASSSLSYPASGASLSSGSSSCVSSARGRDSQAPRPELSNGHVACLREWEATSNSNLQFGSVAGSSQEALTVFQSPIVKGLRAKGNDLAAATKTLARERDELAASIGQPVAEASAILAEKNQLLATVRELRAEIDQLRGQVNTLRAENRDQAAILKILQPEQVTLHSQASSSQAVSSPHFTENYGHRSVFVCPRVLDDPTAEDREKYPDVEKFLITFKNTKGDVADVSYARVLGLKNGKLRIMVSSVHKEAFEECIRTFGFSPAVQANRSTIAHGGVNEMGVFIAEKPAELGFAISLIDNERNTIPPEAHALLRSLSTSQNNWRAVQQEQVSREMLSKYSSTQSSGSSSSSSPKRSDSVSGDNLQPSSSDSQSSSLAFPSSPYLGLAFPSSSSPKARTSSSSSQSSSSVSAGSSSASAFSTTYDSQSSANAGLYSSSSQSSSSSNGRIKDLQSLDPKPSSAKSADSRSKSLGGTLEPTKGT